MRVNNEVEYTVSMKDLITGKIKAATAETNKLQAAVGGVKSSFNAIAGPLGLGISVAGIVSFGKSVVESLKNYEYFSASLRTLMHGDVETAKTLETQLVSLAAKTPFSLVDVQDATKQLLAYGFAAGDVTKNISMLGDVASALKIPFSDIAYLYGTLKTQGRAYTRDIMQFTNRGIPIIHELAKQYGVADSAIQKMVEDGKVGFPQVEKAFKSMTSEGGMFFNMMSEQSKTVGGQLSNLGDNWEQLKVNIGKSQTGLIASTVKWANEMLSATSKIFFPELYKEQLKQEIVAQYGTEEGDYVSELATILKTKNKNLTEVQAQMKAAQLEENRIKFAMIDAVNKKAEIENGYLPNAEKNKRLLTVNRDIERLKGQQQKVKELLNPAKKDNVTTTTSSIDPIKASAPKATQINITFGKLIEKQIVEVQNAGSNFVNRVGDETAQALLNALNDVNRIAAQ